MLGVQSSRSSHPAHHPAPHTPTAPATVLSPTSTTSPSTTTTPTTTKKRSGALHQESHTNSNGGALSPKKVNPLHDISAEVINDDSSTWGEISREEDEENTEKHNLQTTKGQEENKASEEEDGTQQQDEDKQTKAEGLDGNDSERRASSPLSELSPAPSNTEEEAEKDQKQEEVSQDEVRAEENAGGSVQNLQSTTTPLSSGTDGSHNLGYSANEINQAATQNFVGSSTLNNANIDGLPDLNAFSHPPFGSQNPNTLTPEKTRDSNQAGPSGFNPSNPSKPSSLKVSTLLELNAELFKVCSTLCSQGVDVSNSPEAQVFQRKLQSNLHWLAAHADQGTKDASTSKDYSMKATYDLPEFEPPVIDPSQFTSLAGNLERVNELYSQLQTIFAKDIARSRANAGSGVLTPGPRNTSTPSVHPSPAIGIKRERSDVGSISEGRESPASAKRQNTGDGRRNSATPAPLSASASGVNMGMLPPANPMEAMQAQMSMTRPGSSMSMGSASGSISNPPNSGGQISGSSDGVFTPGSASGMGGMNAAMAGAMSAGMAGAMSAGMGVSGMHNMANLSPEARRQMQIRMFAQQQQQQQQQNQALQLQLQQQQQQQQHQHQQQTGQMSQQGVQGGQMSMSPPHRASQSTPSPSQQQLMQNQMARQMSPPGTAMGMNQMNSAGVSPSSATMPNMASAASNPMLQNTQQQSLPPNLPPNLIPTYQTLQNHQHPITALLLQTPGFQQLPLMDQMRKFHYVQRQQQLQQQQRMLASGQIRPPNVGTPGSVSSPTQPQNPQMGMAPQLQASNSDGNMQFTQTVVNLPQRTPSSMGMHGQMGSMPTMAVMPASMSGMNMSGMPTVHTMNTMNTMNTVNTANQRAAMYMQMAQRNPGIANMSPEVRAQMIAAAQAHERQQQQQQRMAAMQQKQASSSPLNPTSSAGVDQQQFLPGLRSNPSVPGIARSARSPTVAGGNEMGMGGVGTPRLGVRGVPGSDEIQRAAMLQAAAQRQGFLQAQGGQGVASWPSQQQQQIQQQQQQIPLSAGTWSQQPSQQGFPMTGSPSGDMMGSSRQSSATPGPMSQQHSPTAPSSGFEGMGW